MKYRKLRIALSAVCGVLCLLLIVLWVRSYRWIENFTVLVSSTRSVTIHSGLGKLAVNSAFDVDSAWQFPPDRRWRFHRSSAQRIVDTVVKSAGPIPPQPNFGFLRSSSARWHAFVRYWIPVMITGALAVVLGVRRPFRFNLRTLLIAMTLVAVLLGILAN